MNTIEQLNIEGKRSGEGFVTHKATLIDALSRTLADRLMLLDLTIGRKGLLGYLKAVAGSNIVKIVPANGSASVERTSDKKLKVICGSNISVIGEQEFIGEITPMSFAEVRISPNNSIKPNMGVTELAEAISRVLPFTATEDNRPVLQCVNFVAGDGKLTMVSADGFRLAVVTLDYDGEGQALIHRDELIGIANALRKAKRVNLEFQSDGESLDGMKVIIDTELIKYRFSSYSGSFPEWQKLIPNEFNCYASFDTVEAIKAVNSLKALSDKSYPIDLVIGDGKILMSIPDDKGQAEIPANTDGQSKVRVDGSYLNSVLRACGGMVDFSLANGYSPILFSHNGYKVVVMPMLTSEANDQAKADREAKEAEAVTTEPQAKVDTEPEDTEITKPQAEAEAEAKPKPSRSQAERKNQ